MTVLVWPLPALFSWALAWAVFAGLRAAGAPALLALLGASAAGALLALLQRERWRRLIVALGFPLGLLALLASGGAALPAWIWLLPLALLALLYPRRTWGDAPLFPTPPGALAELPAVAALTPDSSVLDAGCGLGDGLKELRRVYPGVRLVGIEWSRLLAPLARWRCRGVAEVRRGDMWAMDWRPYEMVYVFQRPESMPRVWAKACAEMREKGAWLVSLDFEVAGQIPLAHFPLADGHGVWVYRVPQVQDIVQSADKG
ncbi:trans-aconitate 2-methyltransferase [Pelomonas sp. KK5]|uniref:class I SAM-dependent methyltransferase n=1 Tax=Pelomonas sp. KK5 TaxID=1855730 RepID=UPI00097C7E1A|nr:class I SAM-dependent methyltransferase [Pelomonas sp. KK5]